MTNGSPANKLSQPLELSELGPKLSHPGSVSPQEAKPGLNLLLPTLLHHLEGSLGLRAGLVLSSAAKSTLVFEPQTSQQKPRPAPFDHVDLVVSALARRDSRLLLSYIANTLETIHFKQHKRLILSIRRCLFDQFKEASPRFGLLGLKLIIKGKIGVGGNAKKKIYTIDCGGCGTSSITNRVSFAHKVSRTATGVLGLSLTIVF